MTEVFYLRCDECGREERTEGLDQPRGWARATVALGQYHFCPECWARLMAHRKGGQP
jgi:hypothetical protein